MATRNTQPAAKPVVSEAPPIATVDALDVGTARRPEIPTEKDYFDDDGLAEVGEVSRPEIDGDISNQIAKMRQAEMADVRFDVSAEAKIIDLPRPDGIDGVARFSAPIDQQFAAAAYSEPTESGNARLAGQPNRQRDQIDVVLDADRYRTDMTFEWARERATNFRHRFSRHYYEVGVLIDHFVQVTPTVEREIADKARCLLDYNASCATPEQRLGYVAHLVGTPPPKEDVLRARRREIVTTIATRQVQISPTVVARAEPITTNPPEVAV